MSNKFSKFIQLGIVGIWICLISVLLYRHYVSGVELSALQSLSGSQFKTSDEWFGIYLQNVKIGFIHSSSEKIGEEYRFVQYGETNLVRDDKDIRSTTRLTCLTDLNYGLKSFEFSTRSGEKNYSSRGEVDEDNVLLVFIETGKQKRTETIDTPGPLYMPATIKQMLYARGLEKGRRFNVPLFNIFSLKVEDTVISVEELIPIKVGANVNTAYLLKVGDNFSWISDGGTTLKEKQASGIVYLAETEDLARSRKDRKIFDYLSLPVLKSGRLLSMPEDLPSLKARLSGIDLSAYPLLNEGRQVLKKEVLTITKEQTDMLEKKTYDLPYQGSDLEVYLAPTSYIQSDHHTIIYNARKFVDIEKNAFRLARFLTSNLYLSMNKMPFFTLNTSMEIFDAHAGESNEHTIMFTAFARAAGLPVRMVGGLVYLKGHFYYHTWPEVWIERWVPADPAMGQFPADVTHIRIMEGDMDTLVSLGEIIRGMKIDIMEAP